MNKIEFDKAPQKVGPSSLGFLVPKYHRDKLKMKLNEIYRITVERINGE